MSITNHDKISTLPGIVYTVNGLQVTGHGNCRYVHFSHSIVTNSHLNHFKSCLPPYATLLGVTLSLDKTRLSVMTGNRVAHPLLITLANINSTLQLSSSSHAFSLLALFLVPKFIGIKKGLHGILKN